MDSKVKIKITKVRRRPDKSEVQRLCGSNKKAKKLINWKPVYIKEKGFKNAISKTINWYKKKKNQRTNLKKDYIV